MNQLRQDILTGKYDDQLDQLKDAIQQRRRIARQTSNAVKFGNFSPGDKVVFNDQARPKYLQGETATVVKLKRTKIEIRLDRQAGKFPANVPITTPVSIVDLLPKAEAA